MAAVLRGSVSVFNSGSNSIAIPLPSGSAVGDWALVGVVNISASTTVTMPGTLLNTRVVGTGRVSVSTIQLSLSDITSGALTVSLSGNNSAIGALVSYYNSDGFGPLGPWAVRTNNSKFITAPATTLDPAQQAVVLRFEKSSNNPGPTVVSPATTELTSLFTDVAAGPSIWVGTYTAPEGDRTFTDPVNSSNGAGVQIGVLDSAGTPPPAANTVSVWNGTTEITGCSVSVWDGSTEITGAVPSFT